MFLIPIVYVFEIVCCARYFVSYYIRQRSWAECYVFIPVCLFVCLSVCLFVCLSVSRITQKVMDGFKRNINGKVASYPRTIPLNFGDDPDSGSGFRIQNIIFLQSLSTQSLFLHAPYVDQERSESLCGETHNGNADISITLFDTQQWKVMTSACHCLTHNNGKC